MISQDFSRRSFVRGVSAAGILLASRARAHAQEATSAISQAPASKRLSIYKSVKWEMIQEGSTVLDKFQLQKELGYDGMELVSPGDLDPQEVRAASAATNMPVHGVVDSKHWDERLSSPDPAIRERGRQHLEQALRDCHAFGGFSVLLVPGAVWDENEQHDDIWQRSIPEIRKTLPLASKLGVRILIENVWNRFCESAEQFRDYIDAIGSPWVGAYFDIGNCRKFGPSEDWIRTLGSRIVKLDVKDWGDTEDFCKIGEGDVNWPEVRKALGEIGFSGWSTAEVEGGGREQLADVARRMDQVLGLKA